jgi:TetR/AcrR family transcriptional regulator, transcriptional repressor for nem operon
MPRNGLESRKQILSAAEGLFLSHGYGGASVDAILERAGLTKGAFFHHFRSKHDLALALIDRYARMDREHLATSLERAERLSRDPLQQVLILVGLYEEFMDQLTEPYPGCLFASYCYQAGLFEDDVHAVVRGALLHWREVLVGKLEEVVREHPPRLPVDLSELADAFVVSIEGAFILSKTLGEPGLVARQLRQYRNYLELLFDVR